jgi:FAD/FMN-containing dehydrogenase/ferredoxin
MGVLHLPGINKGVPHEQGRGSAVNWSGYWIERARQSAHHQRHLYGLEMPRTLENLLAHEPPRLGITGTMRVMAFVLFGFFRGRLRLFWHRLADLDTPAQIRRIESQAGVLRGRVSDRCRVATGAFERQNYSRDMARVPGILQKTMHRTRPFLVVQPRCEEDVRAVLAFARERRVPVYPRGISSSAFGAAVPTRNGIVMDFSCMTQVLAIDPLNRTARVQPGVRWADLASRLDTYVLAPVTTPSSRFSTIGGWASTGGVGIDSFGHGRFSDAVSGARVMLMDGKLLELNGAKDGLRDFLGIEGQFGIFTELTVRVRPKPEASRPKLAYFEDAPAAFAFLDRVIAAGHRPSHVVFYDRERMAEENRLFRDRTARDERIVEERDAILLHFDNTEAESRFLHAADCMATASSGPAAYYLWAERFFPLKAQRLGPCLLASELILPRKSIPAFISRARRMTARFGIKPAIEVIVSRIDERTERYVVIASFPCDPTRRWNYILSLVLVQILSHSGVRMNGCAYGLGIWNAPFISASYSAEDRRRLLQKKHDVDPHHLLNPSKFFRSRTRFFNIPGLLFRPAVFRTALQLASVVSPFLGALARISAPPRGHGWQVPSAEDENGRRLLAQATLRCTSCGSCVSACPAYLITGDELVTGRAKLRMAEAWLNSQKIEAGESCRPFQCLHCGLCEEVCQTHLPLRECYRAIEAWIERQSGYPTELIRNFVQRLDADRELIRVTFGLDLPDWSPDSTVPDLRNVQKSMEARG